MNRDKIISETDIIELSNLAMAKKNSIKYRTISSAIDGTYKFKLVELEASLLN